MRRLSGRAAGATGRLIGRRKSSHNVSRRDESAGPVIMRRRSGSKSGYDNDLSSLEAGLPGDDGESIDEQSLIGSTQGLGISNVVTPSGSSAIASKKPCSSSLEEDFVCPIIPLALQRGTILTKVITKKRRKQVTFTLEPMSGKVFWDSSNPSNPSKRFCIDDIQHIHVKGHARNYREECQVGEESQNRWFTVVYVDRDRSNGRFSKTLHVIAPDELVFAMWTETLENISRYRHQLSAGIAGPSQDERILRQQWNQEMTKAFKDQPHASEDEWLDLNAVEDMCRTNQINCSKNMIRAKFDMADTRGIGKLNFDNFKDFVRRVKMRVDVRDIYRALTLGSPEGLDMITFFEFLQTIQGVDVNADPDCWEKAFYQFARDDVPSAQVVESSSSSIISSSTHHYHNYQSPEAYRHGRVQRLPLLSDEQRLGRMADDDEAGSAAR